MSCREDDIDDEFGRDNPTFSNKATPFPCVDLETSRSACRIALSSGVVGTHEASGVSFVKLPSWDHSKGVRLECDRSLLSTERIVGFAFSFGASGFMVTIDNRQVL